MRSRGYANVARSTSCTQAESIGAQRTCPARISATSRSAARSGTAESSAPKQLGAEEDAGAIVDEAGRDRVVVHRWLHGREPAIADGDGLAGVEQVHRSIGSGMDDKPMIPTPRYEGSTRMCGLGSSSVASEPM